MGDFNTVLAIEDRQGGAPVQEAEIRDFNEYLLDTGMTEIRSVRREFTWTNSHVFSKIDKAVVNAE